PGLALEWEAGKMTIEQENFSAWLRLEFPRLTPGGDPGTHFVRFRILRTEERAPEEAATLPRSERRQSDMRGSASKMNVKIARRGLSLGGALALFLLGPVAAWGQVEGPAAPPPKFEVKRVPSVSAPPAPLLPTEEIIRRF